MTKEKKEKQEATFDSQRETRVLLEQIRSEVKTVSEQDSSVMQKLEEHDRRFEKVEKKLEGHDLQFLQLNNKFDRVEKIITTVLSDHETRIKKVEEKVISA